MTPPSFTDNERRLTNGRFHGLNVDIDHCRFCLKTKKGAGYIGRTQACHVEEGFSFVPGADWIIPADVRSQLIPLSGRPWVARVN